MLLTEPYFLFIFNLLIGICFGNILYRADYCMAGMFRDVFLMKDYTLLRSLYLCVVISMALLYLTRLSGIIPFYPPPTYSLASAATFAGGIIFGVGMVLAGGCVVGTLYKMASGNVTNLFAFIGIISGSMLYAEFHPAFEKFRSDTTLLPYTMLSDFSRTVELVTIIIVFLLSAVIFEIWRRAGKWRVEAYAQRYLQPYKAAVYISLLNLFVYIFSGWPMGITTAYAKIGAYIESFFVPSHVRELVYFNEPSIRVQLADRVITGGAGAGMDVIFQTEFPLIIGIVFGAFLTSVILKEFKIYGLPPKRQILSAFSGGVMLAMGARIASGCNVKFVLGAIPLLAFQGILFVTGMVAGAYIGAVILKRMVLKI